MPLVTVDSLTLEVPKATILYRAAGILRHQIRAGRKGPIRLDKSHKNQLIDTYLRLVMEKADERCRRNQRR